MRFCPISMLTDIGLGSGPVVWRDRPGAGRQSCGVRPGTPAELRDAECPRSETFCFPQLVAGSKAECSEFAPRYIAQNESSGTSCPRLRQRAAMSEISHTRQNSQRRGLTARGTPLQDRWRWFPQGIKRERGARAGGTLYRGCPRNCERLVFGRHDHWDGKILGRWPKAATREPGHLPPATSHARTRWAGCPGVNVKVRPLRGCCPGRMAERATAKIAGDGLRFRRWGVACCLSSAAVAFATVFPHCVVSSSPHRQPLRSWQLAPAARKRRHRRRKSCKTKSRKIRARCLRSTSKRRARSRRREPKSPPANCRRPPRRRRPRRDRRTARPWRGFP